MQLSWTIPMLSSFLLLLLPLLDHQRHLTDACSATAVKEIQTKIVSGKLAAIRCSDIKGILNGGSLLDPDTYVECVPGSDDHGCTGGAECRGFRCGCPDGLVHVGALGCTDVNECALPGFQACAGPSSSVNCVNVQGSFVCNCTRPGQQYNPVGGCADSPECVFPFVYAGKQYSGCTSAGRGFLWCSLTENFDKDSRWVTCPLKYGTTHCFFPTKYRGQQRSGCFVNGATGQRLCSLTNNYDADKLADLCIEVV